MVKVESFSLGAKEYAQLVLSRGVNSEIYK